MAGENGSFLVEEKQQVKARQSEETVNSLTLEVVERKMGGDLMLGRRIVDEYGEKVLKQIDRDCVRLAQHRGPQKFSARRCTE